MVFTKLKSHWPHQSASLPPLHGEDLAQPVRWCTMNPIIIASPHRRTQASPICVATLSKTGVAAPCFWWCASGSKGLRLLALPLSNRPLHHISHLKPKKQPRSTAKTTTRPLPKTQHSTKIPYPLMKPDISIEFDWYTPERKSSTFWAAMYPHTGLRPRYQTASISLEVPIPAKYPQTHPFAAI